MMVGDKKTIAFPLLFGQLSLQQLGKKWVKPKRPNKCKRQESKVKFVPLG